MRARAARVRISQRSRAREAEWLAERVHGQRLRGMGVSDEELFARNPHLMPELAKHMARQHRMDHAQRNGSGEPPPCADDAADGIPPQDDIDFLREKLTDYDVKSRIGQGGQGAVYFAWQRTPERGVALKVLRHGQLATEDERRRFLREIGVAAKLRHPNLVCVYGGGVAGGCYYYAMEYVGGVPIDSYVHTNHLTVEAVLRLFVTICRAVSYAHQRGVIHRDLKPHNILVDLEGQPKVLDFGLAKETAATDRWLVSMPGQVAGTVPYLTPEHLSGQSSEVDTRSDVYALGVILFELLTGTYPYPVEDELPKAFQAVLKVPPDRLSQTAARMRNHWTVTGAIRRDLDVIVARALAKEKDRRYQSADAFADDVERYLRREAIAARADSSLYVLRKTIERHRMPAAFAAMFVVMLAVFSGVAMRLWMKAAAERDNVREIARSYHEMALNLATAVDDSVATLAGGQAIRDELLGALEQQLKGLRSKLEADVELSGLVALLNEKLGDLAVAAGRLDEAAAYYHSRLAAMDAAVPGSDSGGPAALVRVLRKLAAATPSETEAYFSRAIADAQCAEQDEDCRYELCLTHSAYARYLIIDSRPSAADEHASAAVAWARPYVAPSGASARWQAALANAYERQSRARTDLGRGTDALAAMRESLKLKQVLSEAAPPDVVRRFDLTTALRNFGSLADTLGHDDEAASAYQAALGHAEYLTSVDPSVANWRQELWAIRCWLAGMHSSHKEYALAEYHAQVAAEISSELLSDFPDRIQYMRMCAYAIRQQGDIAFHRKQYEKAAERHQLAHHIAEFLCIAEPHVCGHLSELADSFFDIGNDARKRHHFDEAHRYYAQAAELIERLRRREPDSVSLLVNMSRVRFRLGNLFFEMQTPHHNRIALMYYGECAAMLSCWRTEGRVEKDRDLVRQRLSECKANQDKLRQRLLQSPHVDMSQSSVASATPG